MSNPIDDIMKNVIATAKSKESPTVLLGSPHLVGFSAGQSANKDELNGLLGREFRVSGMTYFVSHVGEPGQYLKRGFHVMFSEVRPDSLSISRCKNGSCNHTGESYAW